jgi:prolyl-tRNA editing enzyme YbaK/EbsC (Cys-tRNA(Pro) deacylase)
MSVVTEHLKRRGVPFEVVEHAKAFTSRAEAATLGIEADEVLKTVVLDVGGGHALAVVPADRRLDMHLVKEAVGDAQVHLASEDELASDFPTIELGAFPPIGSLLDAPVYVDPSVREHETVVFAAGTQTESVKARTEELFGSEEVRFVPLAEEA